MGKIINIEDSWVVEICCDACGVRSNHFDCPCCKETYAATDIYGEVEDGEPFICEECYSRFKFLGRNEDLERMIEIIEDKAK